MAHGIENKRGGLVRFPGGETGKSITLDPGKNRVSNSQFAALTRNPYFRHLVELGKLEVVDAPDLPKKVVKHASTEDIKDVPSDGKQPAQNKPAQSKAQGKSEQGKADQAPAGK